MNFNNYWFLLETSKTHFKTPLHFQKYTVTAVSHFIVFLFLNDTIPNLIDTFTIFRNPLILRLVILSLVGRVLEIRLTTSGVCKNSR